MYKITLDIEHLPEGPYLGTSPELPGLVVQGDSVQEVLELAPDLAHDLIAVMVETNQPLPSFPTTQATSLSGRFELSSKDWASPRTTCGRTR